MSDNIELTVQVRTDVGKGASRRLRRNAGLVPAVMYGAGKEPVALTIPHKDLMKATENEAFFSQIITINTGDEKSPAIVKDMQRHPAKNRILHADFFRVRMDQEITVEIPLHFVNEEECVGVRMHNGQLAHNISSIEVSCLPGNLPEYLEVDVMNLDIGDAIHLSQLALPEGVAIPALALGEDHDQVVVTVNEKREIVEDEEAEAAPAPDEVEATKQADDDESTDD
ncbi:MAG: 50S ribosomal protein L25/general stress protein Ctc [Pseudomonadota bacterium]